VKEELNVPDFLRDKDNLIAELREENTKLKERIHEACEVYTGMDGFIPETAPEAYQRRILRQMYEALKGEE